MSKTAPSFLNSEFFVITDNGWSLLPGAPEEIVKEFEEYMSHKDFFWTREERDEQDRRLGLEDKNED